MRLAIVGYYEGLAGQIEALLTAEGKEVVCFINDQKEPPCIVNPPQRSVRKFDYPTSTTYKNLPLIIGEDWPSIVKEMGVTAVLVATPDNCLRQKYLNEAKQHFQLIGYTHPSATIFPEALIEPGAIVLANTIIGYRVEIQEGAFLNNGVQIDHNSCVQTCAHIMPSATICGSVDIGARANIGAGATIVNSIRIGHDSVVGAGALIRKHIPPKTIYVGVPGRFLHSKE